MQHDKRLQKIFYIYPFNTLVEQNLEILEKVLLIMKTLNKILQ